MTDAALSLWPIRPLHEVVDILDSKRVPVNQAERSIRQGEVPYYGATGQVGWIDDYLFDEELVLLGEDGAPFLDRDRAKAYMIRGRSWVNNHAHVLRGKSGVLLNRFLLHFLNTVDYRPYVSGTTRLKLPQGPLKTIGIPLPRMDEQERIVARIEELMSDVDAGLAAVSLVGAHRSTMRAAVLEAAFSGHLLDLPRDSTTGLPEGWGWSTLGDPDIGEVRGGLTKNARRNALPLRKPYLRVANVYADELRLDEVKEIGVTPQEAVRYRLQKDDLLVVEGNGSKEHIGRVALWSGAVEECLHQNHIIRVRLTADVNPRFVLHWLLSPKGRQSIVEEAHTTSGLYTLSTGKVSSLRVPVAEKAVQDRLVEEVDLRLSTADKVSDEMAEAAVLGGLLKFSILDAAFHGRM